MVAQEVFVSPNGSDTNPGTKANPFQTLAKGLGNLTAGDTLYMREGEYTESVVVKDLHGTAEHPIAIRSFCGERAWIDCSVDSFRTSPNMDWMPASELDVDAHPDEFVSVMTFAPDGDKDLVNRGAFLDRVPYTRLITYSQLKDLRANNQTFDKLPLCTNPPGSPPPCPDALCVALPGPDEVSETGVPLGHRRPWVYMGPGLFFNTDTGRIHIRLSHTTHNVAGLADYDGPTDPRSVRLAISHRFRRPLLVQSSSFVRFEDLDIRFGGEESIELRVTDSIVFDHVRIAAASDGVFFHHGNKNTVFSNCELNGGVPPWYFRSDRKAQYSFMRDGVRVENNLGAQTSRVLMHGNADTQNVTIAQCEFVNAHDLYLFGDGIEFHHNWLHNLNDEALVLDQAASSNLTVHHNVIERCVSAISFAGDKVGGAKAVFRNLIDLRRSTVGFRPRFVGDTDVFRFGQLLKSNEPDGPLDLFQNTLLVYRQEGQASFLHYRNTDRAHRRRSFNNVFVAVNPTPASDKPITFVPPPTFPGPTDGNCYVRIGLTTGPLFRSLPYEFNGPHGAQNLPGLTALRSSNLFEQSKGQYPPGYEAQSIDGDPQFRQVAADGTPQETDDLRLQAGSPAGNQGIVLPPELAALDPEGSLSGSPAIGCYPLGAPSLAVGVDGRQRFPA